MSKLAEQAYEACSVGSVGWMRPSSSCASGLEQFQDVEIAAEVLESEGRISILSLHRENQTGKKLIDAIQFRRLV